MMGEPAGSALPGLFPYHLEQEDESETYHGKKVIHESREEREGYFTSTKAWKKLVICKGTDNNGLLNYSVVSMKQAFLFPNAKIMATPSRRTQS